MAEKGTTKKLSDKLKALFSKNRNAPGKGAYPAKFEQTAFKAGQKTRNLFTGKKKATVLSKGKSLIPYDPKKSLPATASKLKKIGKLAKLARVARIATPIGLGTVAAQAIYQTANPSKEAKAKIKAAKKKMSKITTKQAHADLLKNSAKTGKFMKTRSVTVPPSKGFKKEVIDERYNTYPKRIDKRKDKKKDLLKEIELKRIKEKIKKKKETGKKDVFDYIGDILKTPYKIRGGAKHGKMMTKKFNVGGETMLKGGQKKLDKNKDGKISGEDFKLMEKNTGGAIKGMGAARTSGMGLQDENLIPGKSLDYYKDIM